MSHFDPIAVFPLSKRVGHLLYCGQFDPITAFYYTGENWRFSFTAIEKPLAFPPRAFFDQSAEDSLAFKTYRINRSVDGVISSPTL